MLARSLRRRLTLAALISGTWLGAGCGPSEPPRPPLDGGPRDAPPTIDAGPIDAPGADAPADAGPGTDGGIDLGRCRVQAPDDRLLVDTDTTARDRVVSVAAAHAEWAVAYARGESAVPNVFWAIVPTSLDGTAAMSVTTGFSTSDEPAVARTADGWLLAWMSNGTGNFEIFARGYGTDTRPLGAAAQLTSNAERDDGPVLVRVGSEVVAAWLETTGTVRGIRTRRVGSTGTPLAAAASVGTGAFVPGRLATGTRLDGIALAFGSSDGNALVVGLDAAGGGGGAPTVVSAEANASGSVDLALDSGGGAVVFDVLVAGVRAELRGMLLDASGAPLGPERVLLVGADTGNGGSITPFAGGYALAYRALEAATPRVRVLFLSANLDEVGRLDVADAARGARTTIRASGDGRLLVAWADTDGSTGTDIRAARIRCD